MTRQRRIFTLLFLLIGSLQMPLGHADNVKTLTLSCPIPLDSPLGNIARDLYREALKPFGYQVKFVFANTTEELQLLAEEKVDGSCGRAKSIKQLTNTLDHLVQADVPSINVNFYEVRLAQPQPRANPDAPERTAIIRDSRVLESLLTKQANTRIVRFTTEQQILQALLLGQVERAVIVEMATLPDRQRPQDNPDLQLTHFYSMPIHALMLKRHQNVVTLLNRRIPIVLPKLHQRREQRQHIPDQRFDKTLDMVCHVPLDSKIARSAMRIYTRALEQLNYNLAVRYIPRQRATEELIQGRADLDCGRLDYYQHSIGQHAFKIPLPVSSINLHVYGLSPAVTIDNFSDLEPTDRVVYVKGSYLVEKHLQNTGVRLQSAATPNHALKMLINGSVDYYVGFHEETEISIRNGRFNNRIHNLGQLAEEPLYAYLHRKHQALKLKLEHVLQKVAQELQQESLTAH